ncbi:MAG: hypothetical protein M3404_00175 [Actinomycetota bacterium]|nr:hypothetical protein [Actinomycetota bacterium]
MALWPRPAGAATGSGSGSGVTTMQNSPGPFCTHAVMSYKADATYRGTYTDDLGGEYIGTLIVELQPGAGGRVSQNPSGTLDPNCTTGTAGYPYPITGTVRSPGGEVFCEYKGRYWRKESVATADLYGFCSVKGQAWATHEVHTIETRSVDGTPPSRASNVGSFVASDIGQRPPGARPVPTTTTTTTTTTTIPPPAAAPQEAPPPPAPRDAAGPSGPAPGSQEPVRGLTPAQQPPVQQVPPSQIAQQVQAQPAMMLEHQRQLQVERAYVQRRGSRPQTGYLASARRSRDVAPAPAAALSWGAGLGTFGLALCFRRRIERRWVGLLAPVRSSPVRSSPALSSHTTRTQRRGGARW